MIFTDDFKYIDTHCHLDLYEDYKDIALEASKNKTFIIAVTNMPSVFQHEVKLFKNDNVIVSLGLHPQLAKEYGHEINLFVDLLPKAKFIGEIGLDYQISDNDLKKKQIDIFERIVHESAKYEDKVLTVHSRRSSEDIVSIIGSNFPGTIILHWYSGSISTLKKALFNGYLFSINPSMTISKSGQAIIKALPLESILTETDGPFNSIDGKIIKPSDVKNVVTYLAKLHNKSEQFIEEQIKSNFIRIINKNNI